MLQTGVSSEGTTLSMRALLGVAPRVRVVAALFATVKSGAWSPALSCGPTNVIGLPLNVTAALRFCMMLPQRVFSARFGMGVPRYRCRTDCRSVLRSIGAEVRREAFPSPGARWLGRPTDDGAKYFHQQPDTIGNMRNFE